MPWNLPLFTFLLLLHSSSLSCRLVQILSCLAGNWTWFHAWQAGIITTLPPKMPSVAQYPFNLSINSILIKVYLSLTLYILQALFLLSIFFDWWCKFHQFFLVVFSNAPNLIIAENLQEREITRFEKSMLYVLIKMNLA